MEENEVKYTAKEAAQKLNVSSTTILNYIRNGKIKATKVFGKWRIKESELKPFLNMLSE